MPRGRSKWLEAGAVLASELLHHHLNPLSRAAPRIPVAGSSRPRPSSSPTMKRLVPHPKTQPAYLDAYHPAHFLSSPLERQYGIPAAKPQAPRMVESPFLWNQHAREVVERYLGPELELSETEMLAVFDVGCIVVVLVPCGDRQVQVASDMLRQLGSRVVERQLLLELVFALANYLTMDESDTCEALKVFAATRGLVANYMRRNMLAPLVYPFKKAHHKHLDRKIAETSIAWSFYTLVGLLHYRGIYDERYHRFIVDRIIGGNDGLVKLAMEKL